MNKKRQISILISTIIFIFVAIPLNLNYINTLEWFIKFIVLPLGIILISTINYYIENDDSNKMFAITFPITFFSSACFLFLSTIEMRNGSGEWVNHLTCFIFIFIIFIIISFISIFEKNYKFNKKNIQLIFIISNVVLLIEMIYCIYYSVKAESLLLNKNSNHIIIATMIISIIIFIIFNMLFFLNKIINKNQIIVKKVLNKFDDDKKDYLINLYNYSKTQLENKGYKFEDNNKMIEKIVKVPVEKIVEVERIVEVEKEVEKIVEVERIVEIEKESEKVVEIENNKQIKIKNISKTLKEEKVIKPTIAELTNYITENFPDVNIIYGKNNENYKVYRKKKLMCIVQSSSKDYKIVFQRKPISVSKLLIKYPNIILKAQSPKGEQWFKVTNKGNVDEEDLKTIIRFSYKYLVDAEAKEIAKREKAKEKLKAKKAAEKAKMKAKREAEKAKAKAKLLAQKEKQKNKKPLNNKIEENK